MKVMVVAALLVLKGVMAFGQQLPKTDSSKVLQEVLVRAYETNRRLVEVPAAISLVSQTQLLRFNNTSLVPAMNANPGVRMEERSPGSYRLNIRGSSLRSPFGVRNVKVYYNDIPYTDPGGNTYFNQLGFYNITSMEIIKGPGSSLYGAGTGGVILLKNDPDNFVRGANLDYTGGSFSSNTIHFSLSGGNKTFNNTTRYFYQRSDGYRDHTNLERKVVSWDGLARVGPKGTLKAHFLQGDLYYQTPGALTFAEYKADPRAARPSTGNTPGAEAAHASITQKMFLAGFSYTIVWNSHWQSISSLYGAYSKVENPTTRNYERRMEPHFGTRNVLQYAGVARNTRITVQGGLEVQQQYTASRVYGNRQGAPDTLQTDNEIHNSAQFVFFQGTVETKKNWIVTGGASLNLLDVELQQFSQPASTQKKRFNNLVAPRLALLKKLSPLLSVYGSVARGFSPPTSAELLPSTGVITAGLQAENGWNEEVGFRGNLISGRLYADVNLFHFGLQNTIAQRRDASGGDYFVNSGSTDQKGAETYLSYRLITGVHPWLENLKVWVSHTFSDFHYKQFEKVTDDTAKYSGRRLPSVPKHYLVAGLDAAFHGGGYANLTYTYSDPVPLNDANTASASSYNLLAARLGWRFAMGKHVNADVFGAADNILNVRYSLGNDINAFGGRYYNAAPGVNFSAGISLHSNW